jgi:hypothetical protein
MRQAFIKAWAKAGCGEPGCMLRAQRYREQRRGRSSTVGLIGGRGSPSGCPRWKARPPGSGEAGERTEIPATFVTLAYIFQLALRPLSREDCDDYRREPTSERSIASRH